MRTKFITLHREPTAAGMAALGIGTGVINDLRQIFQQDRLNRQSTKQQKALMDYQVQKQLEMWEKTGYGAQMEQLRKAGLNPGLLYGMGGGGGQTIGGSIPGGTGAHAPAGGGEIAMGIQTALQMQLQKAQIDNINADTQNKKANTPNITADTENKILQGVILKYGGKEAERQWNINKELSIEEYGAKANEYEAKKAQLELIIKLHENGTMQKMTETELQKKIQDLNLGTLIVTKTQLENAILELEKDMQTKLGLDRNSPGWLKILGRLFLNFTK